MAISQRLVRKLHQVLGDEAAEDFMAYVETKDSQHAELRGDFAELRADFAVLRAELRTELARFRGDVIERIETRYGDTMKWSFVFWVGSVTTITLVIWALR